MVRTGANRDLRSNATIIPKGRDPNKVRTKISVVLTMPEDMVANMVENVIFYPL
jgi:hypothetical protein